MKCIECEYMKIVPIEDGCGASAKCFKTSKRGKSITWAMTTISLTTAEKNEGKDRVVNFLNSKENAPFWCPSRKNL